ncbi:MAG: terminase small subunit [Ruminiclostridium sp.]
MLITRKQKLFCDEYLIDLNATQAAIRAGYSVETAGSIGSENLKKPEISAYIGKAMAERSKRTGITADRVINEIAKVGFVKATDLIDPNTATIRSEASEEDLACIQSIKVKNTVGADFETTEREIKLCDKLKALEQLGRHTGIFNDKLSVTADSKVRIIDDV